MADHEDLEIIGTDQNFATEVEQFKGVVLVDYWAAWCPPCRAMAPHLEEIAKKYADNPLFKVVKLETDEQPATAEKYNIRSLPTFKFFVNGETNLDEDIVGFTMPPAFIEKIDKFLATLPSSSQESAA